MTQRWAQRATVGWSNLRHVFGSGLGRISLIFLGLILVVFMALAVRGLFGGSREAGTTQAVQMPAVPNTRGDPRTRLSAQEVARREQQGRLEAEAATRAGKTYQSEMLPVVGAAPPPRAATELVLPPGLALPHAGDSQAARLPPAMPGPSAATGATRPGHMAPRDGADFITAFNTQLRARPVFAATQYSAWLPEGPGGNSSAAPREAEVRPSGNAAATTVAQPARAAPGAVLLAKTGSMVFATLDAAVNSDEQGEVIATVQGGVFHGAKLVGRLELTSENMRIRFTRLATSDPKRPTYGISAIAVREQDARQGMADTIDHHTLERYGSLFFSSLLSGYGKAAMQPQGSSLVTAQGQVIHTSEAMTDQRKAEIALGEVGMALAGEVKRGFNRPPTFSIPAQQGMGVIFLQDVMEKL